MAKQRLAHIDGLRGLASVSVMVGHWLELLVGNTVMPKALVSLLMGIDLVYFSPGRLGVVTFFCISGLVIPFSFSGAQPLRAFLVSRFFRLYPAYWFSLGVAAVTILLLGYSQISAKQVIANITMVQYALRQKDVLGVYWTLFIELMFYAICFVAFFANYLHSRHSNMLAVTVFVAIALVGGGYRYTHPSSTILIGVFTYLAAMHFGTLTRIVFLEGQTEGRRMFGVALAVLLIGTVAANTLGYLYATDKTTGWVASNTSYVVGVALFLLCVRFRLFGSRIMVFLGAISYSLYLIHPVFVGVAGFLIEGSEVGIIALPSLVIIGAASIAVATAMHRFIERPSIRIGKRVVQSLELRESLA